MLDPKLLRRLARVMSSEGVTKLSYKDPESGLELALERGHAAPVAAPGPVVMMSGPAPAAPMALPSAAPAAAGGAPEAGGALPPGVVAIESLMVGTFYRSPSPEAEPFVSAGSRITADSVICIVEAMKVMNEIKAELSGEVVEVLVENGEPVEYGQPLFLVKKA